MNHHNLNQHNLNQHNQYQHNQNQHIPKQHNQKMYQKFRRIITQIRMPIENGVKIADSMGRAIKAKLAGEESTLKMINTHVRHLPNRKQNGMRFGIDLGGSNLRVLAIKFTNGAMNKHVEYECISSEILTGHAEQLFDLIASVLERCARHFLNDDVIDLKIIGFTFSFPVNQISLTSGTLIHWTKGFDVKGVVGEDVSKLLMKAIEKRPGIKCKDIALLNDTVGTMLCGAQIHDDVCIGFIMGTGCNACFMGKDENLDSNEAVNGQPTHKNGCSEQGVIYNTEFGGFGSNNEISNLRNKFEVEVDEKSIRPGEQIYEKMISGLYIVEIYKAIMREIKMCGYDVFVDIESVTGEQLSDLAHKANTLNNGDIYDVENWIDLIVAKLLCERVSLVAASGLSAIIEHMGRKKVVISADGSVIQKNHYIRKCIETFLKELLPDIETSIVLVRDGSGTGAAILASTLN